MIMLPTKQGYLFPSRRCGKFIGVAEEFKVGYKGTIVKVQATFGVDIKGTPLPPAIFRESRFLYLYDFLSNNGIEFKYEFDKFMRSRKPTYAMFNNMFMIVVLDGWFDRATNEWVAEKTKLDMYMVKATVETESTGFCVVCNAISTAFGVNTNTIAVPIYTAYRNEILGSIKSCIADRATFIGKRLYAVQ